MRVREEGGVEDEFERGLGGLFQIPHVRHADGNGGVGRWGGFAAADEKGAAQARGVDGAADGVSEFLLELVRVEETPVAVVGAGEYFDGALVFPNGNGVDGVGIGVVVVFVVVGALSSSWDCGMELYGVGKCAAITTGTGTTRSKVTAYPKQRFISIAVIVVVIIVVVVIVAMTAKPAVVSAAAVSAPASTIVATTTPAPSHDSITSF